MTTDPIYIDPKIAAHVDAALAAGFTVYAVPESGMRSVGWVALCLDEDGSWAHIQKPTMALDPVSLDVPIKPSREYGSAVLVDHNGTPEDAVRVLTKACTEPMVTVRFTGPRRGPKPPAPVVPNHGRKTIERWLTAVRLGERGTNWQVRQLAGRLEVGDRFDSALEDGRDFGVLTVTGRRYGGRDYELVVLTVAELDHPVEIRNNQFVTLVGAP